MRAISSVDQVFAAMQQVKASATAFATNFYPVRSKLETWIEHETLNLVSANGAVFFLRKDRDFEHLYFCAADLAALERELAAQPQITSGRITLDLIGSEAATQPQVDALQKLGFKPHSKLLRLSRAAQSGAAAPAASVPKNFLLTAADECDSAEILKLIETCFNPYADQLPALYEMQDAIADRQILAIKHDGKVAAALFFETQGLTSALRYWVVAEPYRSQKLGSALMQRYFKTQDSVVRFILWVSATNTDALAKYEHFGYKPDGLMDQVMTTAAIGP
jgi:GNAT superfamily N-acetyltransferase